MCPHCDPHRPCKGLSYVLFHMSPLVRGIYGCWRALLLHVTINQWAHMHKHVHTDIACAYNSS